MQFISRLSRYLLLLILSITDGLSAAERPKVGLVLSGGAAMGLAHIGTLKMLDSLNIPIDYIAGTSMGGLLGALYSIGYSGVELEDMALDMDWAAVFSDQPRRVDLPFFEKQESGRYQLEFGIEDGDIRGSSGLIRGQNISMMLNRLTYPFEHIRDFDKLPIPFRCVAVDIISGNEVVLDGG